MFNINCHLQFEMELRSYRELSSILQSIVIVSVYVNCEDMQNMITKNNIFFISMTAVDFKLAFNIMK